MQVFGKVALAGYAWNFCRCKAMQAVHGRIWQRLFVLAEAMHVGAALAPRGQSRGDRERVGRRAVKAEEPANVWGAGEALHGTPQRPFRAASQNALRRMDVCECKGFRMNALRRGSPSWFCLQNSPLFMTRQCFESSHATWLGTISLEGELKGSPRRLALMDFSCKTPAGGGVQCDAREKCDCEP